MHKILVVASILCTFAFGQTPDLLPLKVLSAQRGKIFKLGEMNSFKPKNSSHVLLLVRLAGKDIDNVEMENVRFKGESTTYTATAKTFVGGPNGGSQGFFVSVPSAERHFTVLIKGYAPANLVAEEKIRAELTF